MTAIVRVKSWGQPSERRRNGAYYTPEALARVLVEWAIHGGIGRILDPSCGKGVFLEAAVKTLARLGVSRPGPHVYGVDIDPACGENFQGTARLRDCRFFTRDFLSVAPSEMKGVPFRAIVGNPPYVRHHWLKGESLAHARKAAENFSVRLPATSSTWAYFVLHAISFLGEDGRLAMVIPEALLQTDYGEVVQDALKQRFWTSQLLRIHERLFDGTDEVALVLAAGGKGPGNLFVREVATINDVAEVLVGTPTPDFCVKLPSHYRRCYQPECYDLLQEFLRAADFARFGELAKVRIGVVTGANDFFVFHPGDAEASGIASKCFKPVITRASWLKGVDFSQAERGNLTRIDGRSLLCVPGKNDGRNKALRRWLSLGEMRGIPERYKCRVRDPWYVTPLGEVPDAFVTCSRAGYPRLVLNTGRVRATNALSVAQWEEDVEPQSVAVGFLTTVSAAYAELHGRWYGGGVLKVEPGLLKEIPVPFVKIRKQLVSKIDKLLREGNEDRARLLADRTVLEEGMGFALSKINRLRSALARLSAMRKPARRD